MRKKILEEVRAALARLPDGVRALALQPEALDAAEAVGRAMARSALLDPGDPGAAEAAEALDAAAARLAGAVARHLLDTPDAPDAWALAEGARELRERVDAEDGEERRVPGLHGDAEDGGLVMALDAGRSLIREAALERDADFTVVPHPDGGLAALIQAIPPVKALVLLQDRVLSRADESARRDPRLLAELQASAWYFRRWTPARLPLPAEHRAAARASEWALAERHATIFRKPVLSALEETGAMEGWPPRQRALARALRAPVAGVFEAGARKEGRTVLRSLEGGESYDVLEPHAEPTPPGILLFGRLLPWEGGWLPSLGLAHTAPGARPDPAAVLARLRFYQERWELPRGVALEALIAEQVFGARVPRRLLPARGPRDAQATIAGAVIAFGGAAGGLEEEAGAEARSALAARALDAIPRDPVLLTWIGELLELSRQAPRPHEPKKKGKKKRGR